MKLKITFIQYQRLKHLLKIINNNNLSLAQRKIAKADYEANLRLFKNNL